MSRADVTLSGDWNTTLSGGGGTINAIFSVDRNDTVSLGSGLIDLLTLGCGDTTLTVGSTSAIVEGFTAERLQDPGNFIL